MTDPIYDIISYDDRILARGQLEDILSKLPLYVEIKEGHELSLKGRHYSSPDEPPLEEPVLEVRHGAYVINLRPRSGMRICHAGFGRGSYKFSVTGIMDELSGGGACCRFHFNTKRLGLPYSHDMVVDIFKLG